MKSESTDGRLAWHVAACLALSAAIILWIGNNTNIDLALADAAFDPVTHSFPWQHAWIAEQFNHIILKSLFTVLAVGAVLLALWDGYRPFDGWTSERRTGLRVVAMSAVLVPLAISLLKQASASHCPWDLQRYGGTAPYIRLLEWMPSGVASGHCLPGGHASSALWLVSIAAFWWPHRPRKALAIGASMLVLGGAVGWMQQLRGAHFLTHTLWSAWIACTLVAAIYAFNAKGLARRLVLRYDSVPVATQ